MFSNPLPDEEDYRVYFTKYAERYHIKRFSKDYRGRQWFVTQDSIFQDLKRIAHLQGMQQVDELKCGESCRLFKYDFAIAKSGLSPKGSGNRCVVFLDTSNHRQDVLMVYGKGDIPKKMSETQYIFMTIRENFREIWDRLD